MAKPELIVFSQNIIGGVQSYYFNLLSNDPFDDFDKLWIFTDHLKTDSARLRHRYNCCQEIVFEFEDFVFPDIAKKLNEFVSDRPGIIIVNQLIELRTLLMFPKRNKTVIFVCHDEKYVPVAIEYDFLIDTFIAHNRVFVNELKQKLPSRSKDVYYLPYGIKSSSVVRDENKSGPLRLLFVARLVKEKGIFDLKKIDDALIERAIRVEWTIIGDGPFKDELKKDLSDKTNFIFASPDTTEEIHEIAKQCDVFVLPSYLDGVPVALLDAMSVGLVPVISKFNEGIDVVVPPDVGFIVPMGDIDSFAEKISVLDKTRDDLENRSKVARSKILREFNVEDRSRDYFNLFKKYEELRRPLKARQEAPMVSVIMPAYNAGSLIQDSIFSVQAQTYKNWELIVIDDGSTDHTSEIVNEASLNDSRIKYIYQAHQRLGAARNAGFLAAKGDYIAFLDSDDLWMPEKLELQVRIMENKGYDLTFTDGYRLIHETNEQTPYQTVKGVFPPDEMYKLLFTSNYIPIPSVVMRASWIKKAGLQRTEQFVFGCEDWDYWLRMASMGASFYGLSERLFKYRIRSSAISTNLSLMKLAEFSALYNNIDHRYLRVDDLKKRLTGLAEKHIPELLAIGKESHALFMIKKLMKVRFRLRYLFIFSVIALHLRVFYRYMRIFFYPGRLLLNLPS